MNRQIKVAVGLSGGVDSSVAAALLKEAGFDVVGFHMHLWSESYSYGYRYRNRERVMTRLCEDLGSENRCCGGELLVSARKVAFTLGIPFYEIDLRDWFYKQVVEYFLSEVKEGRTPNPCVVCNEKVKFGKMLEIVREQLGCEFLATGHYAKTVAGPVGRFPQKWHPRALAGDAGSFWGSPAPATHLGKTQSKIYRLLQARDRKKDQTYFLYRLTQEQLPHVVFPLGDLKKKEVRRLAKEYKLPTAETPESMEICFVGKSYKDFLKKYAPEVTKPGKVVTTKGLVLGEHKGLGFYTIGQRKNIKYQISNIKNTNKKSKIKEYITDKRLPLYVIEKDVADNILIVGRREEAMRQRFEIEKVNWIEPSFKLQATSFKMFVKIRSQGELHSCKLSPCGRSVKDRQIINSERLRVVLNKPVFGVTPGQSAVFYKQQTTNYGVVGGGVIE